MKRLVYVAGRYSAPSHSEIHFNIWKAREYAIKIWELGAVAICPHLNTFHFEADTKLTQEDFYDGDFAILKVCHAIFMMPGWEKSKGAVKEKEFAEREKIPVFYGIDTLQAWIRRVEGEAAPHVTTTGAPVFGPSLNLNLTIPNVDQKSAREFLENAAPTIRKAIADNLPPEEKPHVALRANSLSKEANAILQELLPCIKRIVAEAIAESRRTYGPVA